MWQRYKTLFIALIVGAVLLLMSARIVPETHQAVVIRTGEPVYTINQFDPAEAYGETGAGLRFVIPFIDRVQMVDRRILDLDMEGETVLSRDQQRLEVNAYARYRIFDPVLFVQRAGSEAQLQNQLQPILTSELRQELGRRTFASLLTPERGNAMIRIRDTLDEEARTYGAQVLDVRIKRADLPEGTPLAAAFNRMRSDREEEAATIRAGGFRDAQIIRAEASAEAARIFAEAFNQDPAFYDFFRAMQSYEQTFVNGEAESSIIMSPDNEYLRQFQRGGR
ncbi:protease modulator HflC [Aurantiacibacter gangjinensis]|nr:protease modulator HflC [Aurantiacibacter gangjinensis]APE27796.1 HflC protein [Aurantiacibacter gangjinensis]